jgi:hypothetical protein
LNLRSYHPFLIDAGFGELEVPIPWWDHRKLRFTFPPRCLDESGRPQLNYLTGNRG